MKKAYVKPELFCEEYELSTAIAGNCTAGLGAYNVTQSDYNTCGYKMGFDVVFLYKPYCDTIPDGEGAEGTLCYQHPNENSLAFSS